ncbi:MAG: nickel pincer cofactor biosynthesis protein LarC [Magnetococcales bacterium]|nr:nickel pincer cofactor biosynthesis protein LarC [Magnetococcales bacterium]
MKIYLDIGSGISGNMFLGACIKIGLDSKALIAALETLDISGWSLEITEDRNGGISGAHVNVLIDDEHQHRHLQQILNIINSSGLHDEVKEMAANIFTNLAEAEAKVHGISVEKVHFHEVGAVDAIIDICSAAYAVWHLGVKSISSSQVPTGSGFVDCQHGRLPIPVPAVAELLRKNGVPIRHDPVEAELVTPTGAAILVTLVKRFGSLDLTRIDRIGYGLGSRKIPGRPNVLRIFAEEESEITTTTLIQESVAVLSSHVDDMNPEWYGPLWDRLFDAGAMDVALIPMTMKKGRPGVRIEVICNLGQEKDLSEIMLNHSTALGVRFSTTKRFIMPRSEKKLHTPWGDIRVKDAGGVWRLEHDDLAKVAKTQGWSMPKTQQELAPFLADALKLRKTDVS